MNELKKYFTIQSLIGIYLVGLVGMLIPTTRELLVQMSFFILLITMATLAFAHQGTLNRTLLILFLVITVVGYGIEVVGVKTGAIFGFYTYGSGLGPKVLNVPPLIGLNWLMLVYCTFAVVEQWPLSVFWKSVTAAFMMTGFDWIMEQAVLQLSFWTWTFDQIPLQNYIGWFGVSLIFHILLRYYRVSFRNKLALHVLFVQAIFFAIISMLVRV